MNIAEELYKKFEYNIFNFSYIADQEPIVFKIDRYRIINKKDKDTIIQAINSNITEDNFKYFSNKDVQNYYKLLKFLKDNE